MQKIRTPFCSPPLKGPLLSKWLAKRLTWPIWTYQERSLLRAKCRAPPKRRWLSPRRDRGVRQTRTCTNFVKKFWTKRERKQQHIPHFCHQHILTSNSRVICFFSEDCSQETKDERAVRLEQSRVCFSLVLVRLSPWTKYMGNIQTVRADRIRKLEERVFILAQPVSSPKPFNPKSLPVPATASKSEARKVSCCASYQTITCALALAIIF